MFIEFQEEGKGEIEIFQSVPQDMKAYLVPSASAIAFKGVNIKGLMQEFKGDGFSAWFSQYWAGSPAIVKVRAGIPVLELRIALKNIIRGKWEKIVNPELSVNCFQMGFVPYILTKALFSDGLEYQTFDIHFELSFLSKIGIDYKTLDQFLRKVDKDEPAELSNYSHACSQLMLDAIDNILHNSYTIAGKTILLHNNVTNILIAALEKIGKDELGKLLLSVSDIEALHHVRELIEKHCPIYLSNDVLVSKAHPQLNAFKLSYGFKRLFGMNPYDYYLQLRFILGKKLLREGNTVTAVANELEYDSATTFIKEFKKRFSQTPKWFQKNGD